MRRRRSWRDVLSERTAALATCGLQLLLCPGSSSPTTDLPLHIEIQHPVPHGCYEDTAISVEYFVTLQERAILDAYPDLEVCFTLEVLVQHKRKACARLGTSNMPVFEGMTPGWHRLLYWWTDPNTGTNGPRGSLPFLINDPLDGGCRLRCPLNHDGRASGVDRNVTVCPPSEAEPRLKLLSPRPGDVVSPEISVHAGVRIDGLLEGNELLCFELNKAIAADADEVVMSRCLDTVSAAANLTPLPEGDYRLRAWLARDGITQQQSTATTSPPLSHPTHARIPDDLDVVTTSTSTPFSVRANTPSSHTNQAAYLRREGFREIYANRHWGVVGGGSGPGSTTHASASDSAFLTDMVLGSEMGVRSIYDAGCGAAEWQVQLLKRLTELVGVKRLIYTGVDIVPELIDTIRQTYLTQQHEVAQTDKSGAMDGQQDGGGVQLNFEVADIAMDPLPEGVDLILCRHALFHNTNTAVKAILHNFNASGAHWLAATTLRRVDALSRGSAWGNGMVDEVTAKRDLVALNRDGVGTDGRAIAMGGYRPLDLEAPPFHLPPPEEFRPEGEWLRVEDEGVLYLQGLGLWRLPLSTLR